MTRLEESIADGSLDDPVPDSPLSILARWMQEARGCDGLRNPDAMALATVDERGDPQVRMVLCRGFDAVEGRFSFYTNRSSPKARALDRLGRASAVFHWDTLARQVRIGGRVEQTSDADSDCYFGQRARPSQIAAWASAQSAPIESREALSMRFESEARRFGGLASISPVARPPYWGGYVLTAERIELWVERPCRLHDRVIWSREVSGPVTEPPAAFATSSGARWRIRRLQP